MIVIEKNIPVPAKSHDARTKYPFHQMEVGDSFSVQCAGEDTVDTLTKRMRTTMGAAGRRLERKFTLAIEGNGIRVWRAA